MSDNRDRAITIRVAETASDEIVVTGFVGSIKNAIIKAVLYNDVLSAEEAFKFEPPDPGKIIIMRTITARLVLDPIMAKQLARWLNGQVQIYERFYGEIRAPQGAEKSPKTEEEEIKQEQQLERKEKETPQSNMEKT